MPLMGSDFYIDPAKTLDDGALRIIFIREGISRLGCLQIFLNAGNGKFLENPLVEHVRVKAFRLEPTNPQTDGGTIMVDGEHAPYGAIQGEVRPRMANVLTPLKCDEPANAASTD